MLRSRHIFLLKQPVKALYNSSSAPIENPRDRIAGWTAAGTQLGSGEICSSLTTADFNTTIEPDFLARMHDLTCRRVVQHPGTADEAAALYPRPMRNFRNLSKTRRSSRFARKRGSRTSVAWLAMVLAILGVLMAMLMMGFAVSV